MSQNSISGLVKKPLKFWFIFQKKRVGEGAPPLKKIPECSQGSKVSLKKFPSNSKIKFSLKKIPKIKKMTIFKLFLTLHTLLKVLEFLD